MECKTCNGEGGITVDNFGDVQSFECPDCKGTGKAIKIFWLNDWSSNAEDADKTELEAMIHDFDIEKSVLEGVTILLASYEYECYEGSAFVLFERDGNLYEVNGAHCSCYGLEGQWEPEETTHEALLHRLDKGNLGSDYYDENTFADELREVLNLLLPKATESTESAQRSDGRIESGGSYE
jgi:hypothetical protein